MWITSVTEWTLETQGLTDIIDSCYKTMLIVINALDAIVQCIGKE